MKRIGNAEHELEKKHMLKCYFRRNRRIALAEAARILGSPHRLDRLHHRRCGTFTTYYSRPTGQLIPLIAGALALTTAVASLLKQSAILIPMERIHLDLVCRILLAHAQISFKGITN